MNLKIGGFPRDFLIFRPLGLRRFSVPLWIAEVLVGLNEIVDGEVVLAVKKPRSTTNDLLELDDLPDRPHQDDVADVPSVHAGGEFL
jgi:hypothetical protein